MATRVSYHSKTDVDETQIRLEDVHRILALDIGTTTVRAHIYNGEARLLGKGERKIELIQPEPGVMEMDQNVLWQQVQEVIKEALSDADIPASYITCMGFTTQRNTFITWDKETGEPFHRFITWQDLRARDTVDQWNKSFSMMGLNKGSSFIHFFTRKAKFLAASVLRFKSAQVTMRLLWMLEHNPKLKARVAEQKVYYGCIETWLVWKLTGGKVFATDRSCASATGMYDPFQMEWSTIVSWLVGIPMHILPELRDTSGDFGHTAKDIFGAEIPITSVVADQQGSMFGQCCFNVGDVKCTMGTGTFIDCNTGSKPHASIAGLYPLVGWKIKDEVVFIAEGLSADTGLCLEWAQNLGLFEDVRDTSDIALSVQDAGGVNFIPAFTGLQAPINDDKACASLIGIKKDTTKAHMLRAILESLAFRFKLLHATVLKETTTKLSKVVKCDGGVSNNAFLVQLVSDLIGGSLDRPENLDTTSLGAAFLAGLAKGVWKSKDELKAIRKTGRLFEPQKGVVKSYEHVISEWEKAVKRSRNWYQDPFS